MRIIIGDFNCALDCEMDRLNSRYNNNRSREVILKGLETFEMEDIWRARNEGVKRFSWFKSDKNKREICASRIDYAIVSRGFGNNIVNTDYITGLKSDHSAVYLAIHCHENLRGTSYWKMNTKLLHNIEMVRKINEVIEDMISKTEGLDIFMRWEILKKNVKDCCKEFARNSTSEKELVMSQLSENITELEEKLDELSENQVKTLERSKDDLNSLMMEKANSLIFRSKVRWTDMGEKNTNYFLSLEKIRYNARTANQLEDENGKTVYSDSEILKVQRKYCVDLFKHDESVNFVLKNDSGIRIPEDSLATKDIPFSEEEIRNAIIGLNNGKMPGCDGVPIEFYKIFWGKIKLIFLEVVKEMDEKDIIPSSMSRGIINLIPKPGKDERFLKNLRPITLLNSDYKIVEKAIANRMQPVMETIINNDQQGFMENRRIIKNIRRILDLIKMADSEDIPMYILQLDWSKCFDKIEFCAIDKSLEYFGFSQKIRKWVQSMYRGFTAQIQNNGHFSKEFEITRSVHQGAPCSSLIFLLCAEIFAQNMRNSNKILGITVGEFKYLMGQYADDTDMSLKYSQQSIDEVMRIIQLFKENAGFTLNYDKTVAYRVGSLRGSDAKLVTQRAMTWTDIGINVLGVEIRNNIKETLQANYGPIIDKAEAICAAWKKRNLSLFGKVNVINALVASLFVYRMMCLPHISDEYVNRFNRIVEDFIWNGHKPKIPLRTLQCEKRNGGVKLIDLRKKDMSLKILWKKILEEDEKMANLAYHVFAPALKDDIWKCNFDTDEVAKLLVSQPFWRDVILAWCKTCERSEEEQTFLWYNKRIKVEGKSIFWKNSYQQGLRYLNQLYSNGVLISAKEAYDKYGLSVMQFNSIISACDRNLKTEAKSGAIPDNKPDSNPTISARRAYLLLNDKQDSLRQNAEKWSAEMKEELTANDIQAWLNRIYIITNIPKYRSFVYRLINRAVITNIHLKHWGKCDSDMCSFCGNERESYMHIFFICPNAEMLWKVVEEYARDRTSNNYTITPKSALMCNILNPCDIINFLGVITMQYIYAKRCLKQVCKAKELCAIFNEKKNVEKYIAIQNGHIKRYNNKWKDSIPVLDPNSLDDAIEHFSTA